MSWKHACICMSGFEHSPKCHSYDPIPDSETAPEPCPVLLFSARQPSGAKKPSFEDKEDAVSAAECAAICKQRRCSLAGFNPPSPGSSLTDTGVCLLAFKDSQEDCQEQTAVTDFQTSSPVLISCVRCQTTALAIEPPPLSQTKSPQTTVPPTTKASTLAVTPSLGARRLTGQRACGGQVTFVGLGFEQGLPQDMVPLFAAQATAASSTACAALCHSDPDCQSAGYNPPLQPGLDGVCLFSFVDAVEKACDGKERVGLYEPAAPALLLCIRCEETTTTLSTQAPTTSSEPTKVPSTTTSPQSTTVTTTKPTEAVTKRVGIRLVTRQSTLKTTQEPPAFVQETATTAEAAKTTLRRVVISPGMDGRSVGIINVQAPKVAFREPFTSSSAEPTSATTTKPTTTKATTTQPTTQASTTKAPVTTTTQTTPGTTQALITTTLNKVEPSESFTVGFNADPKDKELPVVKDTDQDHAESPIIDLASGLSENHGFSPSLLRSHPLSNMTFVQAVTR